MQEYVLSELDSGERLITERVPTVRSVALGFWIGAGSRDEPETKAGVTHFIEHLLFKGSRSYTAQQIAEIFDGLGGVALAFSRGLAGLCGGLLAGLAILGLVFGMLLVLEERKERKRLYVSWSVVAPHRYAGR